MASHSSLPSVGLEWLLDWKQTFEAGDAGAGEGVDVVVAGGCVATRTRFALVDLRLTVGACDTIKYLCNYIGM